MRLTTILTAALIALPVLAQAQFIEIAAGVWQQDPDGSIGYKLANTTDQIDIGSEAGWDKETRPVVRIKIETLSILPNIYAMATPMEFKGNGSKAVNFKFGDQTYDANVAFDSKVSMDHYDLGFYWSVPLLQTATLNTFNIDWGINVRFLKFDGTVTQGTTTETASENLVVPMLYLGAQFTPIDWLTLEAEFRGISYSGNSYYDYLGRIKYKPFTQSPLFLTAGYRSESVDIDEKDIRADLTFKGPFAELGLQF